MKAARGDVDLKESSRLPMSQLRASLRAELSETLGTSFVQERALEQLSYHQHQW